MKKRKKANFPFQKKIKLITEFQKAQKERFIKIMKKTTIIKLI